MIDLLRSLDLSPDGLVGHSVGELGCAYADGSFSAEQTVLAAYWRGVCISQADLPPGAMAAVGTSLKLGNSLQEFNRFCNRGDKKRQSSVSR